MSYVTAQGQKEEECCAHVGPSHDARHGLGVDGVSCEEKPSQQAPPARPQQQLRKAREQSRCGTVEHHVDQVVSPRVQATQSVVETKGEGADGPVRLVAAAVGEERPPEVIVEDVDPRRFGEKVLVGFDSTAVWRKKE